MRARAGLKALRQPARCRTVIGEDAHVSWWRTRRVTVTGGHGFLGKPVTALLRQEGPADLFTFSRRGDDLTRQTEVARLYAVHRPRGVIQLAAARRRLRRKP